MSQTGADEARAVLADREGFEATDGGYAVDATVFRATVAIDPGARAGEARYEVRVTVPPIEDVTADAVGSAVATGWFETMERRLRDAPAATRLDVSLDEFRFGSGADGLAVVYEFEWDDPTQGATLARTFVEYVEGTYVESVIPGYEYEAPVADLLSQAASRGGGTDGSTPL